MTRDTDVTNAVTSRVTSRVDGSNGSNGSNKNLNTTHPPTYGYWSVAATPENQGGWV